MKTSTDYRQNPSAEFIEKIRSQYPVEAEVDRVLTRKMNLRSGDGYQGVSLEAMTEATKKLLHFHHGEQFTISNVRWMTGGASKIQMAFDFISTISTTRFEKNVVTPVVVRMEPAESVVETSRKREFEVLQLLHNKIPVPPCYWIDAEAEFFPYPALIYGFADGVVKPTQSSSKQVSGIGVTFGAGLREKVADQFVKYLAELHTIPLKTLSTLESFEMPEIGTNDAVIKQLNWWRRVWEEDKSEDIPLLDVAYDWLVANAPAIEIPSLVHGDYRSGNFLFDEDSGNITAFLDWELALVGDRHQDLAWSTYKLFGHMAEDNQTFLACGLLPENEFFARYEKYSGLTVDPSRLHYYRILCNFMSVIHSLGTAHRVAKGSKTHQDIVLLTFSKIGYFLLEQLRNHLSEVINAA